MHTREEIYSKLSEHLQDLFEVPEADITPDAKLFEDLDLDSIDAVDLIIKLQELTGKKFPREKFKTVRSVQDIVDSIHDLISE